MKAKHFITLGHLDHGKSSLLGRLLWDMGRIGEKTKSYLIEIGGKEGRQFAYVLDSKKEEQGRGITIDVGHNSLFVEGFSFTFADAPGHDVFLAAAYRAIKESNGAIVVVAADEGVKEQTIKHVSRAQKEGIKDYVVCVNKMDKVNYDKKIFSKIGRQALGLFTGKENIFIIPTSAIEGENITKASKRMPWFQGKTFLQALQSVPMEERSLEDLVEESKKIIRKTVKTFRKPVMLWAGGKDSTAMLAIARDVFGDKLPFPVLFIDTTYKFRETYEFINTYKKKWNLNLIVAKNMKALAAGVNPWSVSHWHYCNELKTKPLKEAIRKHQFDAVFVGIRWDEHGIRGKEQYFSQRNDPVHTRIHPMLHWTEREIWDYIKKYKIAYNPLYDKEEHNGLVYRSIGCWPFTKPVPKDEPEERAGREVDKERLMESLRSLGYM